MTRTYPGWSGLMVVAKASRTGTGRDYPRCTVTGKWRYSPPSPCYRLGIPHRFATTLYKGTVAGVRESALMAIPTRVTMNTSATPICLRDFRYSHGVLWSIMYNTICTSTGILMYITIYSKNIEVCGGLCMLANPCHRRNE